MDGGAPPRQAGLLSTPAQSGLSISLGQYSDRGRKATNQDFHGAVVPEGATLVLKGAAFAIADGISSSPVGHLAAQIAVNSFLSDYYATSDTWTVERAAHRVISATTPGCTPRAAAAKAPRTSTAAMSAPSTRWC